MATDKAWDVGECFLWPGVKHAWGLKRNKNGDVTTCREMRTLKRELL